MDSRLHDNPGIKGLDDEQVLINRKKYGRNDIGEQQKNEIWIVIRSIITEPMFILLAITCVIYYITGQADNALILLIGICIVSGISLFQEKRSRSAVKALQKVSAPKISVLRKGVFVSLNAEEIVFGDVLIIEEGDIIMADGKIVSSNDFSVNEAMITGESLPVIKSPDQDPELFSGTLALSGSATFQVTAVGKNTRYAHIRKLIEEGRASKTPMQLQVASFVKKMVVVGVVAFCIVVLYNYLSSGKIVEALLTGLTLAMSILPEEIPVAVSTFQALGAFRLLRHHVIVKMPQHVEALGSTTVLCVDKTGTLTRNIMQIACLYDEDTGATVTIENIDNRYLPLVEAAMWASERYPFDAMERSIHELYGRIAPEDKRPLFNQVHEYPIGGQPPMMTHVQSGPGGEIIIAAKGAPEAIIRRSGFDEAKQIMLLEKATALAESGLRLLAVGVAAPTNVWPRTQQEFTFRFLGFFGFNDPPIENIADTIASFYGAGISVKMITGDYPQTAVTIASQIGLKQPGLMLTGNEVMALNHDELANKFKEVNVYARMSPEAKMKVIKMMIEQGEVVAMTGDGVNDAPALKIAHVGVAMGKRGSEVAKNAAAIVINDDNLQHVVEAIAIGRKIYDNIKKSVRYIVSIHIPIILAVMLPLILHWKYPIIFTPVHVVFLELLMGATCSIVYENEPMEPGTMQRPPRQLGTTFLSFRQLALSVIQGLAITASSLGVGFIYMSNGADETTTRTMIIVTLIFANVFLAIVNRSFQFSVFKTLRFKNPLMLILLAVSISVVPLLIYVPAARRLFLLTSIGFREIGVAFIAAAFATLWTELVKRPPEHDENHVVK